MTTPAKDLRPTNKSVIRFARLAVALWSLIILAVCLAVEGWDALRLLWALLLGGSMTVDLLVWLGRRAARRPRLGRLAAAWMQGAGWEQPPRRTEYIRPPMTPRRTPGQIIDVGQATYRKERPL